MKTIEYGIVRDLQRNRTNRRYIYTKIYYEKLADTIMEAYRFQDLQGESVG